MKHSLTIIALSFISLYYNAELCGLAAVVNYSTENDETGDFPSNKHFSKIVQQYLGVGRKPFGDTTLNQTMFCISQASSDSQNTE